MTKTQNTLRYSAGAVIGALLALGGVGIGHDKGLLFQAEPTKVVTRDVVKEVPVIKKVYVNKEVTKVKAYRVSVLDDNGKVVETYNNISTFQFRIIGAILTDKTGKTFSVDGNISVEEVK